MPVFTINLTQRTWDVIPDSRTLDPEQQLLEREAGEEPEPDGPTTEERWVTEMAPLLAFIPAIEADMVEVSVQAPEKLDHSDQLKVRDRRRKLDVIYVRGWTPSAESPS